MVRRPPDVLDRARQDAALSHGELFLRYFELGGMSSALELEAFCYGPCGRAPMTTRSLPTH